MKQRTALALIALTMMTAQATHAGHSKPQPKTAPAPISTLSEQDKQHLL